MKYIKQIAVLLFLLTLNHSPCLAELSPCLERLMITADDLTTIGELRQQCQQENFPSDKREDQKKLGPVEERIAAENKQVLQPFALMAHRPNYLLFAAYNDSSYSAKTFEKKVIGDNQEISFDDVEAQFQLSIKFPLMVGVLDNTMDFFAAYTNRSFWQVYNGDLSSPFRETNHEPEAWVQFHPNWEILGFKNTWNSFGINHQSNGQGGNLSRSWNRLFAWLTFERGNLGMSIKPWIRIPEDEDQDDNPDITDYLGHYELSATYAWEKHVLSIMSRNNLESGFSKGAVELSWSFPFWKWPYLRGYVQYFNGYGESLIDYNQHVNRLAIGVSLTDWL